MEDRVRTTDEMDHITPEERNAQVAFCEADQEWWKFTFTGERPLCPKCGGKSSQQIGFQIMTQRTYNAELHGKKKLKNRGGKLLR